MGESVLIILTCPTEKNAQDIAAKLIEEKLAACVHLSEINAMYWWDGRIHQHPEQILNIKTLDTHFAAIEKIIHALHPYEVPAIEMLKLDGGNTEFLNWIKESVTP